MSAKPANVPHFGRYVPQVRAIEALRGWLPEPTYIVRAKDVIGGRKNILTASALRTKIGLRADQHVVLLLFDRDWILERVWNEIDVILGIASAQFDAVVAPSFSVWTPRPRVEHLYNLKRSFVVFDALQELGVSVIPRGAWIIPRDVVRLAEWLNANPSVHVLALDWSTFRAPADWDRQLAGFEHLDGLTRRRLSYLVNGPSTVDRIADVFSVVPEQRATITNVVLASPPASDEQLSLEGPGGSVGGRFAARCHERNAIVRRGIRAGRDRRASRVRRETLRPTPGVKETRGD